MAEGLGGRLPRNRRGDETGLANCDCGRRLGNENRRVHIIAVHGDKLAIRIGVESPVTGINGVAVRRCHLEPTPPLNREIELVASVGQRALNVDAANRGGANAEADLSAFRNGRVAAAILNEKLETSAPFAIGRAEMLESVVLEADAPEPVVRALADRGMTVLRAQPAEMG